jgi:hypothetical protein
MIPPITPPHKAGCRGSACCRPAESPLAAVHKALVLRFAGKRGFRLHRDSYDHLEFRGLTRRQVDRAVMDLVAEGRLRLGLDTEGFMVVVPVRPEAGQEGGAR